MLQLAPSARSAAITIMLILRPIQVWWKPKLLLLIKRKPIPSSQLTNQLQVNAKIFLKGLEGADRVAADFLSLSLGAPMHFQTRDRPDR